MFDHPEAFDSLESSERYDDFRRDQVEFNLYLDELERRGELSPDSIPF